ncbi:hypothetical protein NDU88_001897 [Pleurodeles waltl]|uniref:Uncharacterized protein n=1 Tax=Pleurodeles waltl TaxID=8319 RepID=A0AAV7UBQ3_PLEWA|nr:hypothetical protein NDU88_001897 [Pleurodeles waltl]
MNRRTQDRLFMGPRGLQGHRQSEHIRRGSADRDPRGCHCPIRPRPSLLPLGQYSAGKVLILAGGCTPVRHEHHWMSGRRPGCSVFPPGEMPRFFCARAARSPRVLWPLPCVDRDERCEHTLHASTAHRAAFVDQDD